METGKVDGRRLARRMRDTSPLQIHCTDRTTRNKHLYHDNTYRMELNRQSGKDFATLLHLDMSYFFSLDVVHGAVPTGMAESRDRV